MKYIIRFTNNSKHMGPFPFSMHVWPYAINTYNGLLMREQFDTTGNWLNCETEPKYDKVLKGVYDEVRQITKPSEVNMLMRHFWRCVYNQCDRYLTPRVPCDLPVRAQLVCRNKDDVSYIPFYISQTGRLINNIDEITTNPFRFQYENQIDELESGPIIVDRIENDLGSNAWLYWRRLKQNEIMVDKKMNQIWPLDNNVGKFPIAMINLIRGYSLSK